jgi:ABC-type spermidine/putrescine transport system permease subunit II
VSAQSPRLLLPFAVAAYLGLLAPLVVVIAVSFGPSTGFEFPPRGVTLHWFEAFFASPAFVTAFFQVSLVVGLLAAALATVLGPAPPWGWCASGFSGAKHWKLSFLRRCSCRKFCWERHYTCSMRGLRSRHRSGRCSVPI